jgi:RND family efflux transporter MFP subunit
MMKLLTTKEQTMRKRTEVIRILSSRFVSVMVGLALLSSLSCSKRTQTQGGRPPASVTVAKPYVRQLVEWDEYVGRLEPISTVEIRPRVGGFVESSPFVEGQVVKKGDLLFVIDPRPYESAVRRANALKMAAEAELAAAKAAVTSASAKQSEIEAILALAEDRFQRVQQLRRSNSVSDEEYQMRFSERQQALASKNNSLAQIESAQSKVAAAEAAIETAKAQLRTAEIDLGYTQIRSPLSGRVGRRLVTPGNLVAGTATSTLLTTVVSLDPIHCYFEADESAFLKYTRLANSGQRPSSREFKNPAFLALADEKGFPHQGHMDFVDNRLSASTATIGGRAIFSNASNDLAPGLFAKVRIPGSSTYEAMMLPDDAISTDQSSRIVLTRSSDGSVVPKRVELGPVIDGLRVIRSGITPQDTVIIKGLQFAFPGTKPTPTETKIEPPFEDGLPHSYEPLPPEQWISSAAITDASFVGSDPSQGGSK